MAVLRGVPVSTVSFSMWRICCSTPAARRVVSTSATVTVLTVVSTSASGYNNGKIYDMNRAELLLMSPLYLSVNVPLGERGFKLGIQCSKYDTVWCRPLLPTMWPVKHGNDPTQQSSALARAGASDGLHMYMSMDRGL